MLKKILLATVAAAGFASSAQASVTIPLTMNFASGATFTGHVTLANDYSILEGVSGTLTKYQYGSGYTGTGSTSINWIWANGANFSSGAGNYSDWLMNGPGSGYNSTGTYDTYILLAYNYTNAPNLVFTTGASGYGDNYINYVDPLVSGSFSIAAVPEPATWLMMIGGFGAVGGAMRYRRRSEKVAFA